MIECRKPRYILFGGTTKSARDSDIHYVSARELMSLYRLSPADCILIDHESDLGKLHGLDRSALIDLHPRYDGNYNVPQAPQSP
jgi:hypothetical protein